MHFRKGFVTAMLFLVIFALLGSFLTVFFRHISDSRTLISVAIGCAISANIYTSESVPVVHGGLIFGIDSILYSLFICAVIYKAKDYSIKDAKDMTISTIIAILVSALIELFATWSYTGLGKGAFNIFLGYLFSAVGSLAGVWLMFHSFEWAIKKGFNQYLNILVCILIASFVNSMVYYLGTSLIYGTINRFWSPASQAAFVVRVCMAVLGMIGYFINSRYWKPRN